MDIFDEKLTAVIGRNHDGPTWSRDMIRNRFDFRRMPGYTFNHSIKDKKITAIILSGPAPGLIPPGTGVLLCLPIYRTSNRFPYNPPLQKINRTQSRKVVQ